MNRILTTLIIFATMAAFTFAGDPVAITVAQSAQLFGQDKFGPQESPLYTVYVPTNEKIGISYAFTIDTEDDEQSAIDCVIKFPKYLNIELMSSEGIQALQTEEDGSVAAMTQYDDDMFIYYEFLLPQKNNGTAFIEFQINVDSRFAGDKFPVDITFSHLRPSFFARHGKKIGIIAGIAAGVVVGVVTFNPATGVAAGTATGTATTAATATGLSLAGAVAAGTGTAAAIGGGAALVSYEVMQKTLQEMNLNFSQKYNSITDFLQTGPRGIRPDPGTRGRSFAWR